MVKFKTEKDLQLWLMAYLKAKGYKVKDEAIVSRRKDRVDIVASSPFFGRYIIECKRSLSRTTGYEASGQLNYYSEYYKGYKKVVAVSKVKDTNARDRLAKQGIRLWVINEDFASPKLTLGGVKVPLWLRQGLALSFLCIMSGLLLSHRVPYESTRTKDRVAVVATGGIPLNVRAGPSIEYSLVTTLAEGSSVTVLTEQGGWAYVTSNDGTGGYASSQYLH